MHSANTSSCQGIHPTQKAFTKPLEPMTQRRNAEGRGDSAQPAILLVGL